jgi:uroporphyrinogen-III synthase
MKKVKTILVSQPKPETEKSPYFDLAEKYGVKIDFRPFIHVEGVNAQEFRKNKINILDHSAVIFTSKNSIDHFYKMCEAMRVTIPETMKYFCISESVAFYLQKYIVYRKRKVFVGNQTFKDLTDVMKKHKDDNYLLPCSDILKSEIPILLDQGGYKYTKAVFYKTVCSDLSDLKDVNYDMLVFFSPSGIKSLFQNFPKFEQNGTFIAAFGETTSKAVIEHGLNLNVKAPVPGLPSMTMAIEHHIKEVLKNGKKK